MKKFFIYLIVFLTVAVLVTVVSNAAFVIDGLTVPDISEPVNPFGGENYILFFNDTWNGSQYVRVYYMAYYDTIKDWNSNNAQMTNVDVWGWDSFLKPSEWLYISSQSGSSKWVTFWKWNASQLMFTSKGLVNTDYGWSAFAGWQDGYNGSIPPIGGGVTPTQPPGGGEDPEYGFNFPPFDFQPAPPPDRDDYPSGWIGDVVYFISLIAHYIWVVLDFIGYLFGWLVKFMTAFLESFGVVGRWLAMVFAWMPSPFPEILTMLVVVFAITTVIKLIRG